MQNETWSEFKNRVWGTDYEIWHDGITPGGLEFRIQEEGEHVRDMLFAGLALEDPVAVLGMHSLSAEEVLEPLKKALEHSAGLFKVELCHLLAKIDLEHRSQYVAILTERLQHTSDDMLKGTIRNILEEIEKEP